MRERDFAVWEEEGCDEIRGVDDVSVVRPEHPSIRPLHAPHTHNFALLKPLQQPFAAPSQYDRGAE
jgi:hypothetical protein